MANKVIIIILVFLVILSGGAGYYSYTLNAQVNSLSDQLSSFQTEQAAQTDNLKSGLTGLREETLNSISKLEDETDNISARIGALEDTLEDEIDKTAAIIDTMEESLGNIAAEFSWSVINASQVYQRVSQATVRISDGESTIGSGFIFDNKDHIMTAQHVVENLSSIFVILPDGRLSKATKTGGCYYSDIAVLKLEDKFDIEPPLIADSTTVRIGEPVAAIGSPFNLSETLTTGIVSQVNRYTEIESGLSQTHWVANLIQFDAAANYGNSGCPLFNSDGKIIGMVIARVNPSEGDGIYYAVSSNKLARVADSLITRGIFEYPRLGVSGSDITPQMALERGMDTINGVLVQEVPADGAAMAAGIKVNDVIVAIDGQEVKGMAELTSYLGEHKSPGDTTMIELIRASTRLQLSFNIGAMP